MSQPSCVLMITWDGAGNIPPEITLVRALVEKGNDVYVLCHDSTRERFKRAGSTFLPLKSVRSTYHLMREGLPAEQEGVFAKEHIYYGKGYGIDLQAAINVTSPDIVIVDVSLRYAILEGLRSGKPLVIVCHTLYGVLMSGGDLRETYFQELNDAAIRHGLQPFKSRRQMTESADQVLVFSYTQFDPLSGEDVSSNVLHVGPLRSSSISPLTWSRKFPGRKLVLISLSTSNQYQYELLQRLCDACGNLEIEALVTTGPVISPESLNTPENVTAIQYITHEKVLPHADLLITHAGHGTVMAGVTFGVPMMCIPMGRDQPYIAQRVEALGLGTMQVVDVPIDLLRRTTLSMLDDLSLRKRAIDFSTSLQGHAGIEEALEAIRKAM